MKTVNKGKITILLKGNVDFMNDEERDYMEREEEERKKTQTNFSK